MSEKKQQPSPWKQLINRFEITPWEMQKKQRALWQPYIDVAINTINHNAIVQSITAEEKYDGKPESQLTEDEKKMLKYDQTVVIDDKLEKDPIFATLIYMTSQYLLDTTTAQERKQNCNPCPSWISFFAQTDIKQLVQRYKEDNEAQSKCDNDFWYAFIKEIPIYLRCESAFEHEVDTIEAYEYLSGLIMHYHESGMSQEDHNERNYQEAESEQFEQEFW